MNEAVSAGPASLLPLLGELRRDERSLDDYLERLEARFAAEEPRVQAFLPEAGRFARLRREAAALAAAWPDPAARPPLYGVPVGVKDIFHVTGFATGAGSRLPAAELAGEEGPAVAALRRAGALVAGKTVSTEFAYFAPGPTRNPHDPERTPGGSSSGSAAAVAAGLCPLALGTQTIGSLSRPAAFCGVVAFKPSYERISRDGVIPLAPAVDHVGFFTADVAGAALVAPLLCRGWRPALAASVAPVRPRLAIPEGPYLEAASPAGATHFRAAGERLRRAGFEVRVVAAMPDFAAIVERHRRLVAAEAARVHSDWYARHAALYDPRTAELIERGRRVAPAELAADLAGRERLRRELDALLDQADADLWLAPAAPGPAPRGLASTGDPIMNLPWTHAGVPTLAVPAGADASWMPMGLQLAARFDDDERLLVWGRLVAEAVP